jgi:UDP-N-acetylglucosamine diphosphorylase / glucose-1-phosphate thymidylyltransferase / UDP-N-acetylgalactosamine diphosphorylase / glucosamine-1-phosphate N-acetyltransferase / galactosamine-1-phosphate N-acetyltransferase
MKQSYTSYSYYFKKPLYPELFTKDQNVWEVIPLIGKYAKELAGKEGIILGKGTVVEEGAIIKAPCVIGQNCEIRAGTYIRGNVLIGDNCIIRSEMKNSVIMDDSHAAHLSYVGDSIIGRDCNIGAGAVLSNLRFDGKTVSAKIGDELIDTRLMKFGAVLGDGVNIGCNSVCNPGTLLGKNVAVYPLAVVSGFHAEKSMIRR